MNGAEVLRRLFVEKRHWANSEIHGPEVKWTIRGIDACIWQVKRLIKDQRANERLKKPTVHSFRARDMFYAIRMALTQLKRGERKRGIDVLEKVVDLIEKDKVAA